MTCPLKVSILFITYKHEKFVAAAIQAALAQDYPNLELVVCDDGSPDRTREILDQELANCRQQIEVVRVHTEKNGGFHANFNRGLAACSGEIIVAMSGDDISRPNRVSMICQEFAADPSCMLVCSNWNHLNDSGKDLGIRIKGRASGVYSYAHTREDIYAKSPVCGAVAAYRRSLHDLFLPMEKGQHGEDNCFWFRALLIGNIHYLSESLVFWRSHGDNQSNWQRGTDHPTARAKHLKFLHAHQCMANQWRRDLAHALATSLVTRREYQQHQQTIDLTREWSRLLRLSVIHAPWSLWWTSCYKLLRASAVQGCLRQTIRKIRKTHLPLRVSRKQQQQYWCYYFTGKRT